jgi:hypothetical protein
MVMPNFLGYSAFCPCNKLPEAENLKRRKIYFGSWFLRFHSIVSWPHHGGPVAAQCITEGKMK